MSVVCLGEALVDQILDRSGHRNIYLGGAPANVAVALARLGLSSAFVGCVGKDQHGQNLLGLMAQMGIDCSGIQLTQRPTRIVEVHQSCAGDRTFGQFVGAHTTEFADAHLSADLLPTALLQRAQALVVGTLGLAYPDTRVAMASAADLVKANGGKLIVDLNWRPTFWPEPGHALTWIDPWLAQADWLKLSADEAVMLYGTADAPSLANRFPLAQGLVVTDGNHGCQYAIADQVGKVAAFSVDCQDATGAGDAFLAGFIQQLYVQNWQTSRKLDIESMLTFASALGALATLKAGAIAAQPTRDRLLNFLQERTGKIWQI